MKFFCVIFSSVGAECFDDEYLDAAENECKKCKYISTWPALNVRV